jgi:hypothetical protein
MTKEIFLGGNRTTEAIPVTVDVYVFFVWEWGVGFFCIYMGIYKTLFQ